MRTGAALAAATAVLAFLLGSPPTARAGNQLNVSVDRTTIVTALGHTFTFHTRITNQGASSAVGLIAHLNVLSLRGDVYVDPEDWSSHRTRYLAPLPAGASTTLTWKLDAVNAGHLGVYVALLPRSGAATRATVSPTVAVTIADRRTLNSGGILPLALGIPALLGLITLAARFRRARPLRRPLTQTPANDPDPMRHQPL